MVENGAFSWGMPENDTIALQNINLRVKGGSLVAVVGSVGSGKSSLLSAILGEMDKISGRVNTKVLLNQNIQYRVAWKVLLMLFFNLKKIKM